MPFPYTPPSFAHPAALYISETFNLRNSMLTDYDARKESAKNFNHIFLAQHNAWVDFQGEVNARTLGWLPHAASDKHVRWPNPDDQEWDVCFIGHLTPERVPFIERCIKERFRVFHGWKDGTDYPDITAKSKIGFNFERFGFDMNMRIFETMATGTMLLTNKENRYNGLKELFEDGKHLVLYNDEDEMVYQIKYYLRHPEERWAIAIKGQQEVLQRHLYYHRFIQLVSKCEGF